VAQLASLSNADYERLRPHLEPVRLVYKRSLYEVNKPIEFVHFIETGVSSLVNTMANGDASEVGTIGNEGVVGLPILLGDRHAPTSVYMQVPGAGLRMKASRFKEEILHSASLRTAMLHYAHAFFNQVAQSAACAHYHPLDRRLYADRDRQARRYRSARLVRRRARPAARSSGQADRRAAALELEDAERGCRSRLTRLLTRLRSSPNAYLQGEVPDILATTAPFASSRRSTGRGVKKPSGEIDENMEYLVGSVIGGISRRPVDQ
jgi:hypothetical protein